MKVDSEVTVQASRDATWAVVSEIPRGAEICKGIEKIEILERPSSGLAGLKWRETRILFGKPASVDKWITEAVEGEYYKTRAEDGGFVFVTTRRITGSDGALTLSERHETLPQTLRAKLMRLPMSLFFRGVIRKASLRDLEDLRSAVEKAEGG